jgi:hypothetical protein
MRTPEDIPSGEPPEVPVGVPSGVPTGPDYDRAADRIGRIVIILGILGTGAGLVWKGWRWGGGFFVGALISSLNYRWLRALVESLGTDRPRARGSVFLAFRYLLLGVLAYVIVRFTSVSLLALFVGVLVLTGAVLIEAVIEIVYARN